jgi:K+-sensing histidine kinase KdpD
MFLANMSHELRTPLNAIIGVTEMLREDAESAKQDLEPLDRVLGAARHLLALINDILDLSKIEAGRMELHLESFALASLIDDVVKTIEPLAVKNSNKVTVHCETAIGTMHADQMRLRQALLNLMSNANKFADRRIAEKKLLAWPTAYAKHNQIMLVSLDLHEDGIVGSDTSTHGGLDFQVVLVSEFDDFLENRLLVRRGTHSATAPPARVGPHV